MRDALPIAARLFSWTGALLFFVSLAYFFFSYLIRFGEPVAGRIESAAITWNVALFTIFAMHHSIFARTGIRDWLRRAIPDYLERPVYIWIASILFLIVCLFWRPVPGVLWDAGGAAALPLWGLQGAGIWLTLKSAGILDVRELAGLVQKGPPTDFRASGPYGWVRHPIYAGWFLMVLPAPRMTMTRFVFAVVSCLYLLVAIPLEERTMRRGSDGGYDRYMRQVRWRLIPGVY